MERKKAAIYHRTWILLQFFMILSLIFHEGQKLLRKDHESPLTVDRINLTEGGEGGAGTTSY